MVWNDAKEIDYSLKADSVRRECEKSLSRLDTEVIDLYQIHWPADDLPETEEGWATSPHCRRKARCAGSAHQISVARNLRPLSSLLPSPRFSLPTLLFAATSKMNCSHSAKITASV